MTTKTKSPFEFFKNEVFYSDPETGLDVWNTYLQSELDAPDEVEMHIDPLSSEVSIIVTEEMDPQSGQRPPTQGAPDPDQVEMPDYLSPDVGGSGGNYEEFSGYLDRMSKVHTSRRETEIEKGQFLKYKQLYLSLSKGWSNNEDINRIITNTKTLMKAFPEDGKFLEKAGELLCSFDYTTPRTKIVKVLRKNFSEKEYREMANAGIITKEEAENAIEFSKIKEEAQAMREASGSDNLQSFSISPRSAERFPEAKEDVERRCESCKMEEDGRFLRCERCSMKNKMTFPKVDDQ